MDNLLKEAIADAKAVRETALANAKLALEEAFAPKLQSMLSATIQNENDESDDEESEEVDQSIDNSTEVDSEPIETDVAEPTDDTSEVGLEEDEFSFDSIVNELEEEASEPELPSEDNEIAEVSNEVEAEEENAEVDEEVNLQELILELKAEYSEATNTSNDTEELTEVKKNLQEHRDVIKFLREKLNEVNLLNAKLLFTNKLFKKHTMNESQKFKIIETLDRATTLKECKLVYSTLEETFNGMKKTAREVPAKRIVESIASKPIGSTKPSEETVKTVLNEGNEIAERFKKLAGIIK